MDRPPLGWIGAAWGVGGLALTLVEAIARLWPVAAEALAMPLSALHWAFAAAWLAFMAYAEGWRGFHLRFAPRAVARALHLSRHPRPWHVALAPLFVSALVHATRRRLVAMWGLTAGIVVLILIVRGLPQPWRGLVDLGVVVGLSIGLGSTLWHAARAAAGLPPTVDPDLPR